MATNDSRLEASCGTQTAVGNRICAVSCTDDAGCRAVAPDLTCSKGICKVSTSLAMDGAGATALPPSGGLVGTGGVGEGGGRGGAGGTGGSGGAGRGGVGGMDGESTCAIFIYTSPGCGQAAQPMCSSGVGGACASYVCGCDGQIRADWCNGSKMPFAYYRGSAAPSGDPCDPNMPN
jgi:hypothetical protein